MPGDLMLASVVLSGWVKLWNQIIFAKSHEFCDLECNCENSSNAPAKGSVLSIGHHRTKLLFWHFHTSCHRLLLRFWRRRKKYVSISSLPIWCTAIMWTNSTHENKGRAQLEKERLERIRLEEERYVGTRQWLYGVVGFNCGLCTHRHAYSWRISFEIDHVAVHIFHLRSH